MTGETPAMSDPSLMAGTIGEMPGFAGGGYPPVGQPAVVGEHGPEVAVPQQAGGFNGLVGMEGAARPTLVGKGGPEVITPRQPTTIIPNEVLKAAAAKKGAKKPQPFDDVLGAAA